MRADFVVKHAGLDVALRRFLFLLPGLSVLAFATACGGNSTTGSHTETDAAGSGGAAAMSNGGAIGGGDVTGEGGTASATGGTHASGGGSAAGAGDSSGGAAIGSTCNGVPLPQAQPVPEPTVNNIDPTATLKEIVVSGRPSTYATGGTAGMVSNISVSLRDQGIYSDGSVRSIDNLTADIDYHTQVTWTSSDPTIAGVMSGDTRTAGGIQGFRPGTVTITVALGAVSKSVCFVVTPAVVATLAITGPDSTASNVGAPIVEKQGGTVPLTCTATFTDGTKRDVTGDVAWVSSVPTVASVTATGSTQGLVGGTTAITASLPATVPTANGQASKATATLDVIGNTGLQSGASCDASPQGCAAGLSCCSNGRASATSSCTPTLSTQSPCPMTPLHP